MRIPFVLGIAALGIAVVRFLITRPRLVTVEDPHAPEEFLLQKQQNLAAIAAGEVPVPVAPLKPVAAVSDERRRELVEQTAYFLAKQRGFVPGREDEDWAIAERMVGAGQAAPA